MSQCMVWGIRTQSPQLGNCPNTQIPVKQVYLAQPTEDNDTRVRSHLNVKQDVEDFGLLSMCPCT